MWNMMDLWNQNIRIVSMYVDMYGMFSYVDMYGIFNYIHLPIVSSIHVWYIYLHLVDFNSKKWASIPYMDHLWIYKYRPMELRIGFL